MSARRARRTLLFCLLTLGLALEGCATISHRGGTPSAGGLPRGRALVVAHVAGEQDRPTAEMAGDLLLNTLRESCDATGAREVVAAAQPLGLATWARSLSERLQRGGWPTAAEGRLLAQRFGIATVVAVDVTTYDQVWGKYAKFTRAGVEAQAYHLESDRVLWRRRGAAEVEDMAGRAFRYAMEQAVQELGATICAPRHSFSVMDVWRSWRR